MGRSTINKLGLTESQITRSRRRRVGDDLHQSLYAPHHPASSPVNTLLLTEITCCFHIFPARHVQSELIDVLRKRRSRPDANLNASLSPKRSSAEMYDLRNTLPTRKMIDPDSQVRLVGTDVPDQAPLPATAHPKMPLSPAKGELFWDCPQIARFSINRFNYLPTADPESSSGLVLLSHSAARHKMAVRPKKKGPTRFRRSVVRLCFNLNVERILDEHYFPSPFAVGASGDARIPVDRQASRT